jgi:hypothetical protein
MKAEQVQTLSELYEWLYEHEDPACREAASNYFHGFVIGAEEKHYAEGVTDIEYGVKLAAEPDLQVEWEGRNAHAYEIELTVCMTDLAPVLARFVAILGPDAGNPKIIAVRRLISGTPV